jgi:hypothetical protein
LVRVPTQSDRERIADVILMTALADALIAGPELERVKGLILAYSELEDLGRAWVDERADELSDNAPLFSEERRQLARELTDPSMRKIALSYATKIIAPDRPLQEEEQALLDSLAAAFRLSDSDRNTLLVPWNNPAQFAPDSFNYQRCEFNAPDRLKDQSIFESMAKTDEDDEFRMLVHKVSAMRNLMTKLFEEGGEVHGVGGILRIGPYGFRIDALIAHDYAHHVARFLGPGEALHPLEHGVLSMMAHRLDSAVRVLVVHAEDLSHSDRVFLAGMDPNRVRPELLEI